MALCCGKLDLVLRVDQTGDVRGISRQQIQLFGDVVGVGPASEVVGAATRATPADDGRDGAFRVLEHHHLHMGAVAGLEGESDSIVELLIAEGVRSVGDEWFVGGVVHVII